MEQPLPHQPVLLAEVIEALALKPGGVVVDGTLGAGGHAAEILPRILPGGVLLGIDRDDSALKLAGERLQEFGESFVPLKGRHEEMGALLDQAGYEQIDGCLLDLGVSSMQLDQADRGFSFMRDAPLDMRMDQSSGMTAAEYLESVDETDLARVLWMYGEEKNSRRIAKAIVEQRVTEPLRTTLQLSQLVEKVQGPAARKYKIHSATRTFQALRVVLNQELSDLESTLELVVDRLRPGGRVAVISYHSLECKRVKRVFGALSRGKEIPRDLPIVGDPEGQLIKRVTRKAIRASDAEIQSNPRARSARLRVAERRT